MPAVAPKNPVVAAMNKEIEKGRTDMTTTFELPEGATRGDVLDLLISGKITKSVADSMIAQIDAPTSRRSQVVSWKVSEPREAVLNSDGSIKTKGSLGGAISIYGLGQFPVTFYASQWDAFYAEVEAINAFRIENDGKLIKKASR